MFEQSKNIVEYDNGEVKFSISVVGDSSNSPNIYKLVSLLMGEIKEGEVISPKKETLPLVSKEVAKAYSNYLGGNPPMCLIECTGCGDFIVANINNIDKSKFHCNKCNTDTSLDNYEPIKTTYYCNDCGTKHDIMVYSESTNVSTKCRKCGKPLDLHWNEKKGLYELLK